jgi:phosphoglycerate dehydrogenase-like enzyme
VKVVAPPVVAVDGGPLGGPLAAHVRDLLAGVAEVVAVEPSGPAPQRVDVLLTLPLERAALERSLTGDVRWVHVMAAGVDGFPFDLLGDRTLTCSRGATAPAIAEFVLAAMLAFEKDLPGSWITAPPAQWSSAQLGTLAGRTLGLVGLGAIGSEVARRANAFDMEVLAVRRTAGPPSLDGVTVVPQLAELLHRSDHVVVAAPATPATFHLLGAEEFAVLRRGAHLVNVARGTLIDHEALRSALDEGTVAMASLDVTDPEPLPEGHWLYSHPRVRVSPHISWSSRATVQRTLSIFVDNLHRYRQGEALQGVVDPLAGF